MRIEAFIIHLRRAESRRAQVDELLHWLAPLPAQVLDAVDGRSLSGEDLDAVYRPDLLKPRYPFELRPGEIACFLSHRRAWQAIVDRGLDAGLVLEDDIGLQPGIFDRALRLAETLCEGRAPAYVQFSLQPPRGRTVTVASAEGVNIVRTETVMLRTTAQLVSRRAAERLLETSRLFDRPVDVFLQMFWQTGVCPVVAVPSGLVDRAEDVGGSTIHAEKSVSERIRREWSRFIYRRQIRHLSTSRADRSN